MYPLIGVIFDYQIKQSKSNAKKVEDTSMAKEIKTKKDKKINETKVCAILHSITTVLWLFNAGMLFAGSISSGDKLGWNFWSDIAIAVVFGSCAVSYFIKWRKEKKERTAKM